MVSCVKIIHLLQTTILSKGFDQLIEEITWTNTRGAESIIDHIYTNSTRYRDIKVDHCMNTDHAMIMVSRECKGKFQQLQYKSIRAMKDYTKDDLKFTLLGLNLDSIFQENNPNKQVEMLAAAMEVAVSAVAPRKIIEDRKAHTHWMNEELKTLIKYWNNGTSKTSS